MRAALAAAAVLAAAIAGGATSAPQTLPALPAGWPARLELGMADKPGGAAALARTARFGFRYQYLAGGVNTAGGWASWNENGTFVSTYVEESQRNGMTPVFTYYMLLQSKPGGGSESEANFRNLRNRATMTAYFRDLRLFFARARGPRAVVLHVEPDFWGYAQQRAPADDAAKVHAVVPERAAKQSVAGFAQAIVRLRNRLAPNVVLAYHMSGWGTHHDITYEDPPASGVRQLAARSARFYRSLGARFDIAFADFSDRDAGFYTKVRGNPRAWFTPADFHRHALYASEFVRSARLRLAFWQIPLGNTKVRSLNNTWNHFQDNRVEWLLADPTRAHLHEYLRAGVVAFLFGRGAEGATCACDAAGDGITNPPPVNGNAVRARSADDDGGYFRERARAYYARGAIALPR